MMYMYGYNSYVGQRVNGMSLNGMYHSMKEAAGKWNDACDAVEGWEFDGNSHNNGSQTDFSVYQHLKERRVTDKLVTDMLQTVVDKETELANDSNGEADTVTVSVSVNSKSLRGNQLGWCYSFYYHALDHHCAEYDELKRNENLANKTTALMYKKAVAIIEAVRDQNVTYTKKLKADLYNLMEKKRAAETRIHEIVTGKVTLQRVVRPRGGSRVVNDGAGVAGSENAADDHGDAFVDNHESDDNHTHGDGGCDSGDDATYGTDDEDRSTAVDDQREGELGDGEFATSDADSGWGVSYPVDDRGEVQDTDQYERRFLDGMFEATSKAHIAKKYAAAEAAFKKRDQVCACACCAERKYRDDCKVLDLSAAAPKSLDLLKSAEFNLPELLRKQYQIDVACHESWRQLLLCKSAVTDDQQGITMCVVCKDMLDGKTSNRMPKFAIANGFWIGYTDLVEELACLTPAELALLSTSQNIYASATKTIFFGGGVLQRANLIGHFALRQCTPAEVFDAVKKNAVSKVRIHLIHKAVSTRAEVDAAVKACKQSLAVRPDKINVAVAWLRENNKVFESFDWDESFNPTAYEDLGDGKVVANGSVTVSVASDDLHDITNANPTETTDTIVGGETLPRGNVVISSLAEAAAGSGTFMHNDMTYKTGDYFKNWDPEFEPAMYVGLYAFGLGGPQTPRSKTVGFQAGVAHNLRLYGNHFSQHDSYMLERFTVCRQKLNFNITSAYLKRNVRLLSTMKKVTADEIKIAGEHYDACLRAKARNKPDPANPAGLTENGMYAVKSALTPTSFCIGTTNYAKRHRRCIDDMALFYGDWNWWNTTTENDLTNRAHGLQAGFEDFADPKGMAAAIAKDPTACALLHYDTMAIYYKYFCGYDVKKKKFLPEGGILGKFDCICGSGEEQKRGSLHTHCLCRHRGFPCTPEQSKTFMKSDDFLEDLFALSKRLLHPGLGITEPELVEVSERHVHKHADGTACEGGSDDQCCSSDSECDDVDAIDSEDSEVVADSDSSCDDVSHLDGLVDHGSRRFSRIPLTKAVLFPARKSENVYPPNFECGDCGTGVASYTFADDWIREECSTPVRQFLDGGGENIESMSDVRFDPLAALDEDGIWSSGYKPERACIALHIENNVTHFPGHGYNCFKKKINKNVVLSSEAGAGCRYKLPHESHCADFSVAINGDTFVTADCVPGYRSGSKVPLWRAKAIDTIEFDFGYDQDFNFSAPKNLYHTCLFRCNTNAAMIAANSGISFYVSRYASKFPGFDNIGTLMGEAANRAENLEKAKADAGEERTEYQKALSLLCKMQYAAIGSVEVSGTIAALWMQNGEINFYSNSFAKLYLGNMVNHLQHKPSVCNAIFDDDADTFVSRDPMSDYLDRGDVLKDMPYYEFTMLYRKRHLGAGDVLEFKQYDDKSAPFQTVLFGDGHTQKKTHVLGLLKEGNFNVPTLVGYSIPNNRCIAAGDKEKSIKYMLTVIALCKPISPDDHPFQGIDEVTYDDVLAVYSALIPLLTKKQNRMLSNAQGRHDSKAMAQKNRSRFCHDERTFNSEPEDSSISDSDRAKLSDFVYPSSAEPVLKGPAKTMFDLTKAKPNQDAITAMKSGSAVPGFCGGETLNNVLQSGQFNESAWRDKPLETLGGSDGQEQHGATIDPELPTIVMIKDYVTSLSSNTATVTGTVLQPDSVPAMCHPLKIAEAFKIIDEPKQLKMFLAIVIKMIERYVFSLEDSDAALVGVVKEVLTELCEANGQINGHKLFYLGGAGGTGKSCVIRSIQCFMKSWGLGRNVATLAFSGSAAALVNGMTIHSWASLSVGKTDDNMTAADKGLKAHTWLIIIDEISFVSPGFLARLDRKCKHLLNNEEPFGGAIVMFAGDFRQLNPVGTKCRLFDYHKFNTRGITDLMKKGMCLWRKVCKSVILTKNFRALSDAKFTEVLTSVRTGLVQDPGITTYLEQRCVTKDCTPPPMTPVLFASNRDVALCIRHFAPLSAEQLDRVCIFVKSEVYATKDDAEEKIDVDVSNQILLGSSGDDGGKPLGGQHLYLGQTALLYLTNVNAHLGLANGTVGKLVGMYPYVDLTRPFSLEVLEKMPTILFYHVESNGSVFKYDDLPAQIVPVFPVRTARRGVVGIPAPVSIKHFNLRSMDALTFHKSQGMSLSAVTISAFSKKHYLRNAGYVGLSRVVKGSGLYLFPGIEISSDLLYQHDKYAEAEIERLLSSEM